MSSVSSIDIAVDELLAVEHRSPTDEAFTAAILALSHLYELAVTSNLTKLMARTESATRELLAWHHDKARATPGAVAPVTPGTLVDFPPARLPSFGDSHR